MSGEQTGQCPTCKGKDIPLNSDGTLKVHPYGNHDDRRATACKGNGLQAMDAGSAKFEAPIKCACGVGESAASCCSGAGTGFRFGPTLPFKQ